MAEQRARLCVVAIMAGLSALPASAEEPAGAAGGRGPVRSGCEYDYAPFSIVRPDGEADGFSVQLMRAALKAVGRDVTFETASWPELKQALAQGKLDALPMVARTPEREAVYEFTFPYFTMHGTILVRDEEHRIHGPEDLRGRRVAVLKDDVAHEYLQRANLGVEIAPLPSFAVALRELSEGRHDAVVVQKLLAFHLMNELGLKNLKAVGPPLTGYTQVFSFAVPKGRRELLSALNEGLAIVMADGTFRRLHAHWFAPLEALGSTRRRILVGGSDEYPPYEFLDRNGQPAGYNVDLTRAIARHMGLDVDVQLGPWSAVRARLARGDLDLVQGMFYSAQREETFAFSPPHAVVQHAIAVRRGAPELRDLRSLDGKTILVMAGDILHDLVVRQGHAKQVIAVATQEEALRRLATGEGDCALVARIPAVYWIQRHGWRNLVMAGEPVLSAELGFAARKDDDALLSTFTEGLAAVKRTGEYREIQGRWLAPYADAPASLRTIAGYVLLGAVPLAALLLGSLLWSRALGRQVLRRTEELRAANARLAQADQHKNDFLVMLSHELRNPLAPIRNSVFVLDRAPAGSEQARRAHEVIARQTQHLVRLIDDLLDVTRISRGKVELHRAPLELCGLVKRACEDHRALFREGGIELAVRVGEPVWIDADETRVLQILANLLQNARRFGREGGSVSVAAGAEEGRARIRVADDGVGILPELLPRVFEPFVQAERGLGRTKGGLGLGLALVKGLVELHGGAVSARSEGPGRGAEFEVAFPVAAAPPVRPPAPDGPPRAAPGSKVLVIDDNACETSSLRDALELVGFEVAVALDGAAGIERARAFRPRAVVCDLGMPGMNGFDVARAMRRDPALSGATLIALTGFARPEDVAAAREAGFDHHVAKPPSIPELVELLRASAGPGAAALESAGWLA